MYAGAGKSNGLTPPLFWVLTKCCQLACPRFGFHERDDARHKDTYFWLPRFVLFLCDIPACRGRRTAVPSENEWNGAVSLPCAEGVRCSWDPFCITCQKFWRGGSLWQALASVGPCLPRDKKARATHTPAVGASETGRTRQTVKSVSHNARSYLLTFSFIPSWLLVLAFAVLRDGAATGGAADGK